MSASKRCVTARKNEMSCKPLVGTKFVLVQPHCLDELIGSCMEVVDVVPLFLSVMDLSKEQKRQGLFDIDVDINEGERVSTLGS